jgi:hypothetical protein
MKRVSAGLAAAVWTWCAYRASTQSIIHDEAFTWQVYLAGPSSALWEVYEANHHFLATLLMRFFTSGFGFSELAMRAGALLGAAIFLWSLWRVANAVFTGWRVVAVLALGALHPLILDFLVVARGYGLALALLTWGLAELGEQRPAWRAALAWGFAVWANLVFGPPTLILTALVAWRKRDWRPAAAYAGALVMLGMVSPLSTATAGNFYVGTEDVLHCVRDLTAASIHHSLPTTLLMVDEVGFVVVPLMWLAGAWAAWRGRALSTPREWLLAGSMVAATGSAVLLLAAHVVAKVPLPQDRTGIYFFLLGALLVALLWEDPNRWVRWFATGVGALLIGLFAAQLQVKSFYVWRYDTDTRALLENAGARWQGRPPALLGGSWVFEPTANFYRVTRKWTWLQPVTRGEAGRAADLYLFTPAEAGAVKTLQLDVWATGAVGQAVLAAPR